MKIKKKHLSTNFNRKEVDTFLKEKDAAMEEITIDEDIQQIKEGEKNNVNNNDNIENNMDKINGEDNKSSHILIFKGTFGKDEYNRLVEKGNISIIITITIIITTTIIIIIIIQIKIDRNKYVNYRIIFNL